jgi:uncharacterized membrane protein
MTNRKKGGSRQPPLQREKSNPNAESPQEEQLQRFLENPEIIKALPEEEQKKLAKLVMVSVEQRFSGPLPPPSILEGYNAALENGAERIMRMAEKQNDHRIEMEKGVINHQLKESSRGQWFGFIIGVFTLCLAGFLAFQGREIAGSVIGAAGVTGLVSVFVLGKRMQRKELLESKKSG